MPQIELSLRAHKCIIHLIQHDMESGCHIIVKDNCSDSVVLFETTVNTEQLVNAVRTLHYWRLSDDSAC